MTETLQGQILTPAGWVAGRITCSAAIQRIEPDPTAPAERFILPGFIDLHVHGGGGADVMDGADAIRQMAAFHAGHGTTALLATTVTAPAAQLSAAAAAVGTVMAKSRAGSRAGSATGSSAESRAGSNAESAAGFGAGFGAETSAGRARVLGLHLEGPFISPEVLGAQPPVAIAPDLELVEELCSRAVLRVVTYAPEIDPDGRLLADLTRRGVRAQIGHSACSYAQARAALQAGATGFTHLYNAMSGLQHRCPGAVGAALAHAEWAELILDLVHVDEGAVRAALRSIPGAYCVTDAVAAAGMPPGEYHLGSHPIFKDQTSVRLADGTLAGSVLTMDQALRNLLHLGLALDEAASRCATLPADYLGLTDRGRLTPGAAADLVVVDRQGGLQGILAEGMPIPVGA
jgi:N-acetylglucosamine-6-phosphate deacetylase